MVLSGLNTNIKYEGKIYHVQTEDGGVNNPIIVTLLYHGGTILATRKSSYADILKDGRLSGIAREAVKQVMEGQHRLMIEELLSGKYSKKRHLRRGGLRRNRQQKVLTR